METVKIEIVYTPGQENSVQISGPLDNKMLCYGMLEMAKHAVQSYKPSQIATPSIVVPKDLGKNA
jgi:hypothetical protein